MKKILNPLETKVVRQQLRNRMPRAELLTWSHLKGRQLGVKFRRQQGIGPFIVDFYCPEKGIVIEIDGDSHFFDLERAHLDHIRQNFIENQGMRVLRFTNTEVYRDMENVLKIIRRYIADEPPLTPP